ncbi:MAG: long-chain acyl-CoA synthetase [Candidatus Azotimanducaceae bacterium]
MLTREQARDQLTAPGADYELENRTLYSQSIRSFKNGPHTLRDLFSENCSDLDFFVYGEERYSFQQAFDRAGQIGQLLVHEYDVQKGDRVAISMRNYPEWVFAFMAVTSIGGVAVAMNALWTADEMQYGLADSGSKVLIADQERVDRISPVLDQLTLSLLTVRCSASPEFSPALSLEARMAKHSTDMPVVDVQPEDMATILYTSGSTGHPKGAVSCHLNILSALKSWELDQTTALLMSGLTPPEPKFQPAGLMAVPLFHATGSHAVFLSSFRPQRKLVSMYKWDPMLAAELIEVEKISSFVAPAAMTGDLLNTARKTDRDLSSLQTVGGGGAPRAPEQVKNIATTFSQALPNTGWGMTETNAIGCGIGGEDYLAHPGSSGRCSAVLDIKVVNEAGDSMPAGERGELLIRGASVIEGYWQRPDANASTFIEGWLRTGDVAYVDEEGYLYIVDRIKDLVIRGGENIGCAEVEAGLLAHEAILEASVYSVPDERLGEEVGATIYAEHSIDEADLVKFLEQHIAKFKIPRYLVQSDEPLPRIASGKIDKRNIRESAIKVLSLA